MDLSKLETVRLSRNTRTRIINDYFPSEEELYEDEDFDEDELTLHAAALCMYSATLITKIYENAPSSIKLESNERELELRSLIKSSPKFSHLNDEGIASVAHECIVRDIRNSFAHGNFEINYNVYSKKLYFVLKPRRKDFISNKPIVISAQSLKKANMEFLSNEAMKYKMMSKSMLNSTISSNMGDILKTMILPTQMQQFADDYLNKKSSFTKRTPMNENRFLFIQYILLVSQITYEQDDFYRIFGKESKVFEKISLIRNSIAHDNFRLVDGSRMIDYQDRDKSLNESLAKSVASLLIAHDQKNGIIYTLDKGHSVDSIESLIKLCEYCFDKLFTGDGDITEFPFTEIPKF